MTGPDWAKRLTEDDEWTVRTALSSIASDMEALIGKVDTDEHPGLDAALQQSAARYRDVLDRIENADVVEIRRV